MLLLDQFKSFLAETLASEADGHASDVYHGSIEDNHSCQTDKALLTGIGVSFLRGEFRVRGVRWSTFLSTIRMDIVLAVTV